MHRNKHPKMHQAGSIFLQFSIPNRSKFGQKSVPKLMRNLHASYHRFLIDLWRFGVPKWNAQEGQRRANEPTFFDQNFLGASWGSLGASWGVLGGLLGFSWRGFAPPPPKKTPRRSKRNGPPMSPIFQWHPKMQWLIDGHGGGKAEGKWITID